jgi:hypothetical protein
MKRVTVVLLAAFALSLLVGSSLQAGAKDGKIRWSHKKTGDCKWYPAIKVPEAKGDKPGVFTVKVVYKGGQLAEFFVIGDGDTDLDLVVTDSKGKKVASDIDPPAEKGGGSDLCMCRWNPTQDEEFTIHIINNGKVYNMATAGTN